VSMAEGEVLELQMARNLRLTYEDYLTIITYKTAALISAACRAGALIAKVSSDQVEALAAFGLNLGIGFQLVDDALDFVGHRERLGKPVGNDFKEGKITFPVIHLLENGSWEAKRRIRELLAQEALSEGDLIEVRRLVERHHSIPATMERAQGFLEKAKSSLRGFPDSPPKRSLVLMADFVLERDW
ncbi:MAG: polyprenyl synthetase family protein, partial [Candidatus Methylomirabilales bacterium]